MAGGPVCVQCITSSSYSRTIYSDPSYRKDSEKENRIALESEIDSGQSINLQIMEKYKDGY